MVKGQARMGLIAILLFGLAFVSGIAGGLMVAGFTFFAGVLGFPARAMGQFRKEAPWEAIAAGLFIAWACISFLWSPYDRPDQVWKLAIGVPSFAAFAFAMSQLEGRWKTRVEAALLFCTIALGLFFVAETITGGAGTMSFKLAVEGGAHEGAELQDLVDKSLGHGTALLILLAGPAAALAWREGAPLIGMVIVGLAVISAFGFSTEINILAVAVALLVAALAYFQPRGILSALFGLVGGMFVVIPLTLPGLIGALPQGLIDTLPTSWVMRLEIWSFASEQLRERLWTGWGLDASRVLGGPAEVRGLSFDLLPLHPHNAALNVWLETGAFGAMLLAFALVMIGGRVAGAPRLSRLQAASIAWVVSVHTVLIMGSYGIWQEWLIACTAVAIGGCTLLGARRQA